MANEPDYTSPSPCPVCGDARRHMCVPIESVETTITMGAPVSMPKASQPITFFEAMAAMRAGSVVLRRVNDRHGVHWAKMRIAAAALQQQTRWSGTWFTCNAKFNALLEAQWFRLETEHG